MKVSVLIPCFNEGLAIAGVVKSFKNTLPEADIHVFDNASSDDTREQASHAGAIVHSVKKKGKGHVVRAMFRDVIADYYVMVDGDGTYSAKDATKMLNVIEEQGFDMVVGSRMSRYCESSSRPGHQFGNKLITRTVNYLFKSDFEDILSGYRVLSHSFVKTIPLFSEGFEVETSISIHAIEVDIKICEIPIKYGTRTEGTQSKLNTVTDGIKILFTIFSLFKDYNPKLVYGVVAILFFIAGGIVGIPVLVEYHNTGLVPKFPSAILASGLMILAFLSGFIGIVISSISKNRRELKKLAFLSLK